MATKTIGRFEIVQELGRGAQGVVYLARDVQLGRQVAIKTLRSGANQQNDKLLREARIASNLQHPNIVTLYDVGELDGDPYLVYAYIKGMTLAQLLKKETTLPPEQAARIASGILDGLACAHAQGVLHLDIKPANIMIMSGGQPLIMDFGIARAVTQLVDASGEIFGTPQYMAPECVTAERAEFRSDLFSVGMVLYEMVTGKPAASGGNVFAILNSNAHVKAPAPSSRNAKVDEQMDSIILKSISKKPEERYPDAPAMRHALQQYLEPPTVRTEAAKQHSTLEFLLRRMRTSSDFPLLSNTISEINEIVSSESSGAGKLTQVILQDFALTNKLLRQVNTVSYGQFGGNIHTISKAVAILGFETVRDIATSLILLEYLQNKAQAENLKDEIAAALLAAIVATKLPHPEYVNLEEVRICAMFHNLGRMLAVFYLFEESRQISRLMHDQNINEEQASIRVLGLSYNELGVGVARNWRYPDRIVAGMHKLHGDKIKKSHDEIEQIAATVNLANELCHIAATTKPEDKEKQLNLLHVRYHQAVHISERGLSVILDNGLLELSERSDIDGISITSNTLLGKVHKWIGSVDSPAEQPASVNDSILLEEAVRKDTGKIITHDAESMLNAGIQDVTNILVSDFKLNDVLQVVLETIYRCLNFRHTVVFIRDESRGIMAARFGFGENIDKVIPRLRFPLKFVPDVFHLAIEQGVDIVIENMQADNIVNRIPDWLRDSVDSQCFLLLPIMVNNKAVGLIYADMEEANSLKISKRELGLLRTLRNQAVLAIKQKA